MPVFTHYKFLHQFIKDKRQNKTYSKTSVVKVKVKKGTKNYTNSYYLGVATEDKSH